MGKDDDGVEGKDKAGVVKSEQKVQGSSKAKGKKKQSSRGKGRMDKAGEQKVQLSKGEQNKSQPQKNVQGGKGKETYCKGGIVEGDIIQISHKDSVMRGPYFIKDDSRKGDIEKSPQLRIALVRIMKCHYLHQFYVINLILILSTLQDDLHHSIFF